MQVEGTKICKGCEISKPESEFPQQTVAYKGKKYVYKRSTCKACKNKQLQEWRGDQIKPRKSLFIPTQEKNMMKSPVSWSVHKGSHQKEVVRTYPLCDEGHRYVGKQCLPCKYGLLVNTMA